MSDEEKRKTERAFNMEPSEENAKKLYNLKIRNGEGVRKLYAVVATAYDYNDEYYYTIEGEPYNIQEVYVSEERAKAACAASNRSSFLDVLGDRLYEWVGYDGEMFNDGIDGKSVSDFLGQYGVSYEGDDENESLGRAIAEAHNNGKISDEVLDKIYAASSLSFHRVEAIDLVDGLCGETGPISE